MVKASKCEPEYSGTHNWDFAQCFGDKADLDSITEGDVISAVEFDTTGEYLATGDRGGRIVLFKREDGQDQLPPQHRFYTEFQSHDREFDYLKSLEIEEKINQIRWCRPTNNARYLLSTNDKTIKLWKVFEKSIQVVSENNGTDHLGPRSFLNVPISQLRLPRMNLHDTIVATAARRTYANGHAYHINSIGVNSDGETFLSSDDLRINLWNLDKPDLSFNIVDIRPASMEELTEVITATECHPQHCNEFIYSTCKGNVRLADMRERALCDQYAKLFVDPLETESESFFTEITSSISDIKYSRDGRYIIARDFMSVKIWDVAMERQPVETIHVHDNIKQWLCTSYETDSIFDKFEVEVSGDSRSIMTGSYSSNFFIYPNAMNSTQGSLATKGSEGALSSSTFAGSDALKGIRSTSGNSTSSSSSSAPAGSSAQRRRLRRRTKRGRKRMNNGRRSDSSALTDDDEFDDDDIDEEDDREEDGLEDHDMDDDDDDDEPMDDDDDDEDDGRYLYRSKSRSSNKNGRKHPRRASRRDMHELFEMDEDEEEERDVIALTANKNVFRKRSQNERTPRARMNRRNSNKVDFRKNILHLSWHPFENTVAIAATNNLFVFNAQRQP